jgi:hypothetical protein
MHCIDPRAEDLPERLTTARARVSGAAAGGFTTLQPPCSVTSVISTDTFVTDDAVWISDSV